jgi:hypothetical protein
MSLESNNIRRIAKADDIPACNQIVSQAQNLSVAQELNLTAPTSSFRFRNAVVYGISQDDLSTSLLLYPSQAYPKLITEYAVKAYIDRPYLTTATFSNANFHGSVVLFGDVFFRGQVKYKDLQCSNITIDVSLSNVGTGYHYGSNWFYASSNYFTSNIVIGGTTITSYLLVESNATVVGSMQVQSNISTPTVFASNATISNIATTLLSADQGTFGSMSNIGSGFHYGSNWFYASSNYFTSNVVVGGTVSTSTLSVNSNAIVEGVLQVQSNIITPCNVAVGNTITASNATFCNLGTTTLSATTSSILDGVVYIRKIAIM